MNKTQNIFLVGPMGAGKTTVGKFLAKELRRDFYDTDIEIEKRTGVDIAWIFDVEGEEGFRKRETEVLDELSQLSGIVLSTGGGVVVKAENRNMLSARGIVVYLKTTIDEQVKRTEKDRRRPLLQTDDREETIKQLHEQRNILYQEIADHVFDTDSQTVKAVATSILNLLIEES